MSLLSDMVRVGVTIVTGDPASGAEAEKYYHTATNLGQDAIDYLNGTGDKLRARQASAKTPKIVGEMIDLDIPTNGYFRSRIGIPDISQELVPDPDSASYATGVATRGRIQAKSQSYRPISPWELRDRYVELLYWLQVNKLLIGGKLQETGSAGSDKNKKLLLGAGGLGTLLLLLGKGR